MLPDVRHANGFAVPRVLVPALAQRLGITRAVLRTEIRRGNWTPIARGIVLTSDRVLVLTRTGRSRTVGSVHIRRTERPYGAWVTSSTDHVLPAVRVVAVPRAVADAGVECGEPAVVRSLVAAALQRRACTLQQLAAVLDDGPRNGSLLLRKAVHDLGDGARSEAELVATRRLSRAAAVPAFELNVSVVDERGRLVYVVDVLWRALRAGLEVDSRECHFSDQDWQRTLRRHNDLTRWGLSMTHYSPSRIARRGDPWLSEVADWLTRRAAELGVTPTGRGVIAPPSGLTPLPFVVRTGRLP